MLKGSVLVLNKFWQPLYLVSFEEGINLLFQGRGKIVLEDYGLLDLNDWLEYSEIILEERKDLKYIRTKTKRLIKPNIILMHNNHYQPRIEVSFSRKLIEIRDKGKCQYCGKKLSKSEKTIDHVIPKSRGGENSWENVVLCCKKCNKKKGDKTPEEANMKLLNKPKKPKLIEMLIKKIENNPEYQGWIKFLNKPII